MREVTYEQALHLSNPYFIDVRSPSEYAADHIIGSVNIPVFDDDERRDIGTIYHTVGRDNAFMKGGEIVGRKIAAILSSMMKMRGKDTVINCYRGGMRSSSIVALMSSLGFNVYKLAEGYKGYRKYIRERIDSIEIGKPVFILHGLTGTGKTAIIRRLGNALDLEEMAGHRSSVFGALGLVPNTQKHFESLLIHAIDKRANADYLVIEGESRKIGDIHIPSRVMRLIHESPAILIQAPLERRIDLILREYSSGIDTVEIVRIVESLKPRLGKNTASELVMMIETGNLHEFVKVMLEKYYDPLYRSTIDRLKFISVIDNMDEDAASREVEEVIRHYR